MATQHSRSAARMMMAPAVILLLGWMLVPLVMTLYFSFKKYLPLRGGDLGWVGFDNYARFVTSSAFWPSIATTLIIVGGVLAIQGQITVGALVAALAAYKDLSSPWRDLLTYYNQVQDMSLRWKIVTERFAPKSMIDDSLFDAPPDHIPRLRGDIDFNNVTVVDQDGNTVLEDIKLHIPEGSRVAIKGGTSVERAALADAAESDDER